MSCDVNKSDLKKCPICGKEFIMYDPNWIYRFVYNGKTHTFCGWNCMRKFEKKYNINRRDKFK